MITLRLSNRQIPLIHFVESDDLFLHDQVDVVWFDVLNSLDYHKFQVTAAHYYEQLFTFNQQQKQRRIERQEDPPSPNPETHSQATQRTLLERSTLDAQGRYSTSDLNRQRRSPMLLRTQSSLASHRRGCLAGGPSVSSRCSMPSSARPSRDNRRNRNSSTSDCVKILPSRAHAASPSPDRDNPKGKVTFPVCANCSSSTRS